MEVQNGAILAVGGIVAEVEEEIAGIQRAAQATGLRGFQDPTVIHGFGIHSVVAEPGRLAAIDGSLSGCRADAVLAAEDPVPPPRLLVGIEIFHHVEIDPTAAVPTPRPAQVS